MSVSSDPSARIVVIGGGVIGLGIAWQLARSRERVTVVDPAPGRGASFAAAGMLAPVTEAHYGEEILLRLNLDSLARYPRFVDELEAETGMQVGYRSCGTLLVARDNDDNAALSELFSFQQRLGLQVRRLRSRELLALEPGLVPSVRGGIEVTNDHQIDNRALLTALLAACRGRGVDLVQREVDEVRAPDGVVTSVVFRKGDEIEAGTVVVAAGARSGSIRGVGELSVRPVKGQLLHLRARDGVPIVERNIRGLDVYMTPRADGRLIVGATVEEKGFDTAVTAGAVHDLLHDAAELVPGVIELELLETVVGHRPGTADNAPLLGPGSIQGLVVATGHYRNGLLLLPVTADAIARTVISGGAPKEIAPFSPLRFSRAGQSR